MMPGVTSIRYAAVRVAEALGEPEENEGDVWVLAHQVKPRVRLIDMEDLAVNWDGKDVYLGAGQRE